MMLISELDNLEKEQFRLDATTMAADRTCMTCINRFSPACNAELQYSGGFNCDSYDRDDRNG